MTVLLPSRSETDTFFELSITPVLLTIYTMGIGVLENICYNVCVPVPLEGRGGGLATPRTDLLWGTRSAGMAPAPMTHPG